MMEAARTSETLVNFYQTTRCYNPEDSNLHTHCRENLKSYLSSLIVCIIIGKSLVNQYFINVPWCYITGPKWRNSQRISLLGSPEVNTLVTTPLPSGDLICLDSPVSG
jgi:hypothetical protein